MLDLLLVGGGLANGLIAERLSTTRPEIDFLVLEAGEVLGGNHTWSYHGSDLDPDQVRRLAQFRPTSWEGYSVRFVDRHRRLSGSYHSIASENFHAAAIARFGDRVRLGSAVRDIGPERVVLESGESLAARAVIDGRGPRPNPHLRCGYQVFLGQEIELIEAHGLSEPILMDAAVDQSDGYRFVYVLPFGPERLLVEDTYYRLEPDLDEARSRERIASYVAAQGWRPARVTREEKGCLPITLAGDIDAFWGEANGVARSGLAAGLFHPTTGFSLPDAVRFAEHVASEPDLSADALFSSVRRYARARWKGGAFYRALNRMLLLAAEPHERHRVMERFYGLPELLIRRFYGGRSTLGDKLRILAGKPPVSIGRAAAALLSDGRRR